MIREMRRAERMAELRVPVERADGTGNEGWFPIRYPAVWRHLTEKEPLQTLLVHPDGLRVMISVLIEADGHPWLHVSLSRSNRLPSYADLTAVKAAFIGRQRKAIQVFPAEAEPVNLHFYCLHVWSALGHDPLPDFTRGNGII